MVLRILSFADEHSCHFKARAMGAVGQSGLGCAMASSSCRSSLRRCPLTLHFSQWANVKWSGRSPTFFTGTMLVKGGRVGGGCRLVTTERRLVNPRASSESGGGPWTHQKRIEVLQLGTFLPTFSRKKGFAEEKSRPTRFSSFSSLFRGKVVRDLLLLWRGTLAGHGGETQVGTERNLLQGDLVSHLLKLSLIFSLYLGSACYEPSPALARAEDISITSGRTVDSINFSGGGRKLLLSQDTIQSESYEGSPSLAGGNFQPRMIFSLVESSKVCEESYGFLPCSNSLGGNISLIVAYGYFLLLAAQLISNGSELLLEVMNPGLLGGLLLPILGALPDALLIFVSGVGGTVEEAQEQVMVGIGVLAGSIVMLLTLGWAGSLYTGRCDLTGPGGTAKDRTLTRSLDWTGTGVTTDEQTRLGAWIMALSTIPFVVVQVPLLDGHPAEGPEAALLGSIASGIGVLGYCFYQVSYPWLQQKRIQEARLQFMRSCALQRVTAFSRKRSSRRRSPILLQDIKYGPSLELLRDLFVSFDSNKDGKIQKEELKGLLVGLELEGDGDIPDESHIDMWLQEFDVDSDSTISEQEFLAGIGKWANRISQERWSRKIQRLENSFAGANDPNFWAAQSSEAKKVLDLLEMEVAGEEEEEEEEDEEKGKGVEPVEAGTVKRTAALYLAGGAALAAIFADPLVSSIGGFSTASGIPPFFVAFVVTPFASNASELFSSIIFARGRRKKNISLTFSQLYGGVTMNNTLCLGLFLGVVYVRGLNWDFSSEVTVILLSVVALAAIGGSRTTFPLWLTLPVLAIYPLCIATVAVLDNALGWH